MTQNRTRWKDLLRWRPGELAGHGGRLFGWMLLRMAAQALTVLLLARALGAETYGQVVAVLAVAGFLVPFVGLGLSHLLLRNAARDPIHGAVYFACALRWWWRTLLPCMGLAILIAAMLLPDGLPYAAACTAIAVEIAATSITELCARHRQAQQDSHAYGATTAGLPLLRLFALILLFSLAPHTTAETVLWVYAISGLPYVLLLLRTTRASAGAADAPVPEPMTVKDGLPFSLAAFATKLQAEYNKPILAQSAFDLAGSYNVAQRAVDIASLPLLAMQEALWPRLYSQANPMRQLRRTGLALLALALLLGAIVWLAAPLLPLMLGPSFSDTVAVLRMLAWLPALQTLRYLINFHAIHRAWTHLIGWTYGTSAIVGVTSVTVLVPHHGMQGAVISAYLTELALTMTLLITCLRKHHHARHRS